MGQRLVITVQNHGKNLAKIYYHWSAYSRSALEEARTLIHHVQQFGRVLTPNEVYPIRCYSCGAPVIGNICDHCGTPHHGHSITEKDMQLVLIRFCEQNGGGITGKAGEYEAICKMFPGQSFKTEGISRNDGLIAITKDGMDSLQGWSEGDITICLASERLINTVLYTYGSVEEHNKEHLECDENYRCVSESNVPELSHDPENITFDSIDDVCEELGSLSGYLFRRGKTVYELIA